MKTFPLKMCFINNICDLEFSLFDVFYISFRVCLNTVFPFVLFLIQFFLFYIHDFLILNRLDRLCLLISRVIYIWFYFFILL